jgi:hypothetical protein
MLHPGLDGATELLVTCCAVALSVECGKMARLTLADSVPLRPPWPHCSSCTHHEDSIEDLDALRAGGPGYRVGPEPGAGLVGPGAGISVADLIAITERFVRNAPAGRLGRNSPIVDERFTSACSPETAR